ncbi:MAG: response regulator [Negativicutes bacterium]|nr:response regulator [Negativicutes bacterium]
MKTKVLFVDDEPHILSSIRRATVGEKFEALFAGGGQEALRVMEENEISVIVTDMRMPGMDGLMLLKIIREKYPKTVRMVLSGFTQLSQVMVTINQGDIFQFIPKPWEMEEELLSGVRQAIERYDIEKERDNLRFGLEQKNRAYLHIFQELEQRRINAKKEVANLKRINHWIFTFWKKQMELGGGQTTQAREVTARYIDTIENIQLAYIEILPTKIETKPAEKIVQDIVQGCDQQVVFCSPLNAPLQLAGYHAFLVMAFQRLVQLYAPDPANTVSCEMNIDKNQDGGMLIDCRLWQKGIKFPVADLDRLKIGCSLLNEIGKSYGVEMVIETKSEMTSIKLVWKTLPLSAAPEASKEEASE